MLNALGNIDNGSLPSKCPIHSRNPPSPFLANSADRRNSKDLPIKPLEFRMFVFMRNMNQRRSLSERSKALHLSVWYSDQGCRARHFAVIWLFADIGTKIATVMRRRRVDN
jgi:hypothetical protein